MTDDHKPVTDDEAEKMLAWLDQDVGDYITIMAFLSLPSHNDHRRLLHDRAVAMEMIDVLSMSFRPDSRFAPEVKAFNDSRLYLKARALLAAVKGEG